MDCSLLHNSTLPFLPSAAKPKSPDDFPTHSFFGWRSGAGVGSCGGFHIRLRKFWPVVAAAGASRCEPGSSLNAPLEPRSAPGRFLSSVLLNQRQLFLFAAADELKQLADARDATVTRMFLSSGSDEACLHRRIAQLKQRDCQTAIEDIMYMLVFYKFSEIRVPLVPKLSRCIYNGRLEIWPSKDWELESIHSFEVLQLIKEHVSAVIGLRVNSSVTENWATTQILKLHLGKIYAASILYGYFLKSASQRHQLECTLALAHQDLHLTHRTAKLPTNLVFGHSVSTGGQQGFDRIELKREKLRCYISGFDPETLQKCAKPRSKEAVDLIEKQSVALFGDDKSDEVIVTSFSSMRRLVLEAVAFGSFLWDTEEYVDRVYKLKENDNAEEDRGIV